MWYNICMKKLYAMFYYWLTTTRAQRRAERLRRAQLAMIQFYEKGFMQTLKEQTPFAHLAVERPLPTGKSVHENVREGIMNSRWTKVLVPLVVFALGILAASLWLSGVQMRLLSDIAHNLGAFWTLCCIAILCGAALALPAALITNGLVWVARKCWSLLAK